MATTQKSRNDIAKTKKKITEQQNRLRAQETQLAKNHAVPQGEIPSAAPDAEQSRSSFGEIHWSGSGGTCSDRLKGCSRHLHLCYP